MTRLALLVLLAAPLSAQPTIREVQLRPASQFVTLVDQEPSDTVAVLAPIQALFDGMRQADSTLMRSAFHADATLRTTQARPGADPSISETPIAAFLASIAGAGVYLDEQLTSTQVRIDGPLATAWTAYRFYVGEEFSHCGVNAFTLVHTDGAWKILHIVDTRRREGCAE